MDDVGFFEFPQLPVKKVLLVDFSHWNNSSLLFFKGDYLIQLETSLSIHSFKYSTVEQLVSSSSDSHTILQFMAEVV